MKSIFCNQKSVLNFYRQVNFLLGHSFILKADEIIGTLLFLMTFKHTLFVEPIYSKSIVLEIDVI